MLWLLEQISFFTHWPQIVITWCAAVNKAGSNAENAAAAATAAALLLNWRWVFDDVELDARSDGKLTYGATLHGSNGVDTGGLCLDMRIPAKDKICSKSHFRKIRKTLEYVRTLFS